MNKTPNDVYGRQINCINFEQCPVCYGCRNYNKNDPDCYYCLKEKKNNICNTNKHKADLIGRFVSITKIEIKDNIELINGGF